MKEGSKKRVAVVSEDRPTAKLIDLMLNHDEFSVELLSAPEFIGKAEKKMPSPSVIIYDYSGHMKGEAPLCQPINKYPQYEKTPRVIISTFSMECEECPGYKAGWCGHIQKPFHLEQVRGAIDALTNKSKT